MQQEHTETPLEDILNRETPAEEPVEEGQEQPPEEPTKTPAEEPKAEQPMVPLAAVHEARDLARDLKAELEAMKAAQKPKEEPKPVPDPIVDPDAFREHNQGQFTQLEQALEQKLMNSRLNMSEYQAVRTAGSDKVEAVKEWVKTQPEYAVAEILQHPDPYAFAIEKHESAQLAQKMSDPETRRQFEAFLANQNNPSPAPTAPATTANARNVGGRAGPQWAGPTPLEQILPNP